MPRFSLARQSPPVRTLVAGVAAFAAYFAMYAFRKPVAAAGFVDIPGWHHAIDYKTALLIAQVIGYAVSKLIGVRIIAEAGRAGRGRAIVGLVAVAWSALLLFAVVPPPWHIACLFLNGLPLGMIWGLVFSYLEGRRTSELLGAMLCASFILSSGVVKSVAVVLMALGVSEFAMPAATGALFFPLLLAAVAVLERLPPPDARDEAERVARRPMLKADRLAFLRAHGGAMLLLVAGYVLLTALRDFRDNFAAELWAALGARDVAALFSLTEIPVAITALAALGALMLVRDNLRALLAMHGVVAAGAAVLGLATWGFEAGAIGAVPWMILAGTGLYLGYTPFNAMLFDRMIAALGRTGNAGFLIYVADASGYAGSVALLVYRSLVAAPADWLGFFIGCCYATALIVPLTMLGSAVHFVRLRRAPAMAH
jgi:hypothetical protein